MAKPMSFKKNYWKKHHKIHLPGELRELTTAPTKAVLNENKPKLRLIVVIKWI